MPSGAKLASGAGLVSPNGQFRFVMQIDGNVVVYKGPLSIPSSAIWSSGTFDNPGAILRMKVDGNLCLINKGVVLWSTNTNEFNSVAVVMQNDGRVVLLSAGGHEIWYTGESWLKNAIQESIVGSPVLFFKAGSLRKKRRFYQFLLHNHDFPEKKITSFCKIFVFSHKSSFFCLQAGLK